MNRKEQIKEISKQINNFVDENINHLDVDIVENGVRKIADKYGLACNQIAEKNEQGVISNKLYILGDLILFNVNYDTDGKEDTGNGVDAKVESHVIGIEDKELFLKSLDTSDTRQRLLYLYVAGKDVSERYS